MRNESIIDPSNFIELHASFYHFDRLSELHYPASFKFSLFVLQNFNERGKMARSPAIGIDLGTTYSCVGVYRYGQVEIIANDQGYRTTPSSVAFTDTEILVGNNAHDQASRNFNNTIFDVKRLIGRNFDDATVQADMKKWPFEVINDNEKPKIKIQCEGVVKTYSPEQISSLVLKKMKDTAEAYLGQAVTNAVITVPAHFNDSQRRATKEAASDAGLSVLRLINEPTAAAVAYGLEKKVTNERYVLIFDLGGGTFDVSILIIKDGIFDVKTTAGDAHLGGQDFDNNMVNYFVEEFNRAHKKDLVENKKAIRRLRNACENAKRTLSSATKAEIDILSLHDGIDFDSTISRARFEDLNAVLFDCVIKQVRKALRDADLDESRIDDVVLVGGSSRIPKVQNLLQDLFSGKDLNKSINPDEAVAYGAAVQAAILNGDSSDEIKDILLLDVTSLSLGIRRRNRGEKHSRMEFVINRNTTIPTRKTKEDFTTRYDNQTSIKFDIYEGESDLIKDNHWLGKLNLKNLVPAAQGQCKVDVTFEIDADGILSVTATERSTGNENMIKIEYNKNRPIKKRTIKTAKNKKSIVAARDSAESYYLKILNFLENTKESDEIDLTDKHIIVNECNSTARRIANKLLDQEQLEEKRKELACIFHLITAINAKDASERNSKYCDALNVAKGASAVEVEEAYRELAFKYHSDRFKGDQNFGKFMWMAILKAKDAVISRIKRRNF